MSTQHGSPDRPGVVDAPRRGRGLAPRLPLGMADFTRRGFRVDRPQPREHLERHAKSFLTGYNLAAAHWPHVRAAVDTMPAEERGFAHEGTAMYAGQRDVFTRGRSVAALLAESGADYPHLIHVGAGWALAVSGLPLPVRLTDTPLLRWLAYDGAGFAEVFFGGRRALRRRAERAGADPLRLIRLAGSGRALWFMTAGDPDDIQQVIAEAPAAARPALWSGVGLASAYAGGVPPAELDTLRAHSGAHVGHLVQGVVFGATARTRSGIVPAHTALACERIAGTTPDTAAEWAARAAADLGERADVTAYLRWREGVRALGA
ncbi:DUF1702 family protein [Actinokineospora cianjurensis]|uniref:Uncharacterized protein DUF1702 n=1 Tax=Actinokineospora cianjurensis TaxID=585224 RepID=A0A421B1B3_9PSEU|nr:DUF1702 family protein [Actinokineospora cianjurensis]RLK58073.1 uncharacterized protein DUF1702 [Actinokineospora cianjurensis]